MRTRPGVTILNSIQNTEESGKVQTRDLCTDSDTDTYTSNGTTA